ncbi:MAG: cytochrome P460 family protein [Bryobacteraceae bacterium]
MKRVSIYCTTALLAIAALSVADQPVRSEGPQFNAKSELLFPANYREWVFLSSGLGMNYGPITAQSRDDHPSFDNVFVSPPAYRAFLESGRWPDKTMFVLEVRSSQSKGSINNGGHYQGDVEGIEAEVKDESRFTGKWAFFGFGKGAATGKQLPATAGCYSCHGQHGAVDNTFVQFYPTLATVAKEKGTFKEAGH